MSDYTHSVGGVDFAGLDARVDSIKGLPALPEPRSRFHPDGPYEPLDFSISLWLAPMTTGNAGWAELEAKTALVLSQLSTGRELTFRQHGRASNVGTLTRMVTVRGVTTPEHGWGYGTPWTRVTIMFRDTHYFWNGANANTTLTNANPWANHIARGAYAPILDGRLDFIGPCTAPKITFPGGLFQYTGSVEAGKRLRVSASNWTASLGNADGSGPTTNPGYNNLRYTGANGRFFRLDPTHTHTITGIGDGGSVVLNANYKYF